MQARKFVGIRQHCATLAGALAVVAQQSRIGSGSRWETASDWFYMAASIDGTIVDTTRFDGSIDMCGDAWDAQTARSLAYTRTLTEISRFLFCWGGFEGCLRNLSLPVVPTRHKSRAGLIDRAVYYLATHPDARPVPGFRTKLTEFQRALESTGNVQWAELLEATDSLDGVGVSVVRHLRNEFAHGSRHLIDDPGKSAVEEVHLIQSSLSIVLLTLQELLRLSLHEEPLSLTWLLSGSDSYTDSDSGVFDLLHLEPVA